MSNLTSTPLTVQDLAALLQPLVDGSSPHALTAADWLTDGEPSDLPEYIQQVLAACDAVLIRSGGYPAYDAHRELLALTGCQVRPGEQDSFGWLTGVLCTPSGKVMFG